MKSHPFFTFSVLVAAVFLGSPSATARAEQKEVDTKEHRKIYEKIKNAESGYKKVKATHTDDPVVFELEGFYEGKTLRKIVARTPGEDGGGFEELYFHEGKLLFTYNQYQRGGAEKPGSKVENRLYFKDGKLLQWLGEGKKSVASGSVEFKEEEKRVLENAGHFVECLKKALDAAEKSKPAAASTVSVEGTFLGIEEGDYAHWQMKTSTGEQTSYFLLKPDTSLDAVLAKPNAFKGKKCRVKVKKSQENIPEAGGEMEVEQVLSVEWVK